MTKGATTDGKKRLATSKDGQEQPRAKRGLVATSASPVKTGNKAVRSGRVRKAGQNSVGKRHSRTAVPKRPRFEAHIPTPQELAEQRMMEEILGIRRHRRRQMRRFAIKAVVCTIIFSILYFHLTNGVSV